MRHGSNLAFNSHMGMSPKKLFQKLFPLVAVLLFSCSPTKLKSLASVEDQETASQVTPSETAPDSDTPAQTPVAPLPAPPPPASPTPAPAPGPGVTLPKILSTTSNLVLNPGFEFDSAGWDTYCCSNWAIDTTQARSGAKALKISPNGMLATGFLSNHITPGQTYRATVYGKLSIPTENAFVGIRLHNSAGAEILNKTANFNSSAYQAVTLEFTAPADTAKATLYFYKHEGTSDLFVDDISVVSISNPLPQTFAQPSATPPGGIGYPFGSHEIPYVAGIRPTNAGQTEQDAAVKRLYTGWKSTLSTRCGNYMVNFSQTSKYATVSEGIGYGMLITAIMAGYDSEAKTIFNGLFKFARSHPATSSDPNLMDWAIKPDCTSGGGGSNAADGDFDIAMALLLADKQWGSEGEINYMAEAVKTITAIKLTNFVYSGLTLAVYQGMHRTSDDMISHFRAFKKATGDTFWDLAVTKGFEQLQLGQSFSPVGLIPGWIVGYKEANLRPSTGWMIEGPYEGQYDWNANRIPWRLATDFVTSGDTRSQAIAIKLQNFFRNVSAGDPSRIGAGYKLDGSVEWQFPSLSFVGPITAGAMVDTANQKFLNDLYSFTSQSPLAGYYDNELQILSLIVATGNWWQP